MPEGGALLQTGFGSLPRASWTGERALNGAHTSAGEIRACAPRGRGREERCARVGRVLSARAQGEHEAGGRRPEIRSALPKDAQRVGGAIEWWRVGWVPVPSPGSRMPTSWPDPGAVSSGEPGARRVRLEGGANCGRTPTGVGKRDRGRPGDVISGVGVYKRARGECSCHCCLYCSVPTEYSDGGGRTDRRTNTETLRPPHLLPVPR